MLTSYLAGEGHEDSETGQVSASAYGVTLVHLNQEAAVPGPVAVLPTALPEDTEDLLAQGLHLKIEWARWVLAQEEQLLECRPALGWRMRTWLRATQVVSVFKRREWPPGQQPP